ncbi:MAG: hypothetical protein ACTH30_09440 [Leucobacter sp.]
MADIDFDDGLAAALSETARSVADELQSQAVHRSDAAHAAGTDFAGAYAVAFGLACWTEALDRGRLAGALHTVAGQVDAARVKAQEERARLQTRAEWRAREEQRLAAQAADPTGSAYAAEAASDPEPSTPRVAAPTITAVFRQGQRSRSGRSSPGKSSADPEKLRAFATRSRGLNTSMDDLILRTQTAWSGFTASCGWVRFGTISFLDGFTGMLRENQLDVVWVGHIAEAFEKAGGLGSLPNTVIQTALAKYDARIGTNRYHPLLEELFGDPFKPGGHLKTTPTPETVGLWWAGLTEAQRAELLASVPLVIGNLDGIPISTRIEANALTADYFASRPDLTKNERTYWEGVAKGSRTLMSSDPANYRIIEMVGTLTPATKNTVTYIPGTGASMKDFYGRGMQVFAEHLVEESGGETVAFVYKDGPWATWAGSRRNSSAAAMQALGDKVASFQNGVVGLDPIGGTIPQNGITHSAGLTITTAAERKRVKFDNVISLSGSYVMPGWSPVEGTKYHHMQYDNEAINLLDDLAVHGTPHKLTGVFTQHIFDGEGTGKIPAHNRIAQGPGTNPEPLERAVGILEESR